ncbi:unnamed protein product [Lathyrus sativus]|nr:unnamed protein product [Lathyrus sativus]
MEDSSNCDIGCEEESVLMIPNQKTTELKCDLQALNIDLPSSSDVDVSSMVSMSSWDSEPEKDISPEESLQDSNLEGNHFVEVENIDDDFSWEVDNRSYEELLKKFMEKEEELRVSNLKLQLSEQDTINLAVQVENSEIQINDVCEKLELKEVQILKSENELDSLRGELNQKNDQLDNVRKELELKEEELNEQKKLSEEEIFKLEIKITKNLSKIRNLTEQVDVDHKKLKILTDENESLRKELGMKSSMTNQLQCQIKEEKRKRVILENLVIMNEENNNNHEEELRKLNLKQFDLQIGFFSHRKKMEADIASLSKQKKQLTSKLEDCESRNKELKQKLMRNEAENLKHFQVEIRYLRRKLDERVIDVEEANVKIDKLNDEICSRDGEISDMKKYMEEINTSREVLVVEENKLKLRVEELEQELIKQKSVILNMADEKKEAIRELCNSLEHYKTGYNEVLQAYEVLYESWRTRCFSFLV